MAKAVKLSNDLIMILDEEKKIKESYTEVISRMISVRPVGKENNMVTKLEIQKMLNSTAEEIVSNLKGGY